MTLDKSSDPQAAAALVVARADQLHEALTTLAGLGGVDLLRAHLKPKTYARVKVALRSARDMIGNQLATPPQAATKQLRRQANRPF